MARVVAVAAVIAAALFTTAPAGAESVCIHKDNCVSNVPGPVGGGLTDHFTVKFRLFGAEVVHPTGVTFYSNAPIFEGAVINDTRVGLCVNGACSGETGYILGWHPLAGNYLRLYVNGTCQQFAEGAGYFPGPCILS